MADVAGGRKRDLCLVLKHISEGLVSRERARDVYCLASAGIVAIDEACSTGIAGAGYGPRRTRGV